MSVNKSGWFIGATTSESAEDHRKRLDELKKEIVKEMRWLKENNQMIKK